MSPGMALRATRCAAVILAAGGATLTTATERPVILPAPRAGEWLEGTGSVAPLAVERSGGVLSREANDLLKHFRKRLPRGNLPPEGYLLQVGSGGALAVVADDAAAIRLRQTLRQLPDEPGACPRLRIADWPEMRWRGLHVLDAGPAALPAVKRLIHEILAPRKCNVLVYEIDYNFQFVSHPEMGGPGAWTRTQVGEMVQACRQEGIRLIPEINCLGHQSWLEPPGALLRAHPGFEEIPDGNIPQTRTGSGSFYCRSWCPLHPEVHPFVCDLIDELVDAFESDAFHCGMDETFVLASDDCPRCRGKRPGELFARAVNDLHAHLSKRGKEMLIWGDRLLNANETGYSMWEASADGSDAAMDLVPKDIIVCDWHYSARKDYPSLRVFPGKGFRTWPTTYSSLEGARRFMAETRKHEGPLVLGVLTSIWMPVDRMAGAELPDSGIKVDGNARRISRTAAVGLEEAWAGERVEDPAILPAKTTFTGELEVRMQTAGRGAVIRYTTDGSDPTPDAKKHRRPLRLTETTVVTAALADGAAIRMGGTRRRYEKLVPREPAAPGKTLAGLEYAAYLAEGMGWESMPDFGVLAPAATGTTGYLDPGLASRPERYGIVFSGYLDVPRDGLYTFTLASDDGSQFYIGEKQIVDCDGLHPRQERTGEAALKAGLHPVRVLFFQAAGAAVLELFWEGPSREREKVPAEALRRGG